MRARNTVEALYPPEKLNGDGQAAEERGRPWKESANTPADFEKKVCDL
jgi:hypothetical protein